MSLVKFLLTKAQLAKIARKTQLENNLLQSLKVSYPSQQEKFLLLNKNIVKLFEKDDQFVRVDSDYPQHHYSLYQHPRFHRGYSYSDSIKTTELTIEMNRYFAYQIDFSFSQYIEENTPHFNRLCERIVNEIKRENRLLYEQSQHLNENIFMPLCFYRPRFMFRFSAEEQITIIKINVGYNFQVEKGLIYR